MGVVVMVNNIKKEIMDRNRLQTHPKKVSEMTREERIATARIISSVADQHFN